MKKIQFFLYFFVPIFFMACSSDEFEIKETDIPQNVIRAFRTKYPAAQVKKWKAEKEGGKFYFEAEINDGTKEKEVHITADGLSVEEDN